MLGELGIVEHAGAAVGVDGEVVPSGDGDGGFVPARGDVGVGAEKDGKRWRALGEEGPVVVLFGEVELQGAEWAAIGVQEDGDVAGGGTFGGAGDEGGEGVVADEGVEDGEAGFGEGGRNVHARMIACGKTRRHVGTKGGFAYVFSNGSCPATTPC